MLVDEKVNNKKRCAVLNLMEDICWFTALFVITIIALMLIKKSSESNQFGAINTNNKDKDGKMIFKCRIMPFFIMIITHHVLVVTMLTC